MLSRPNQRGRAGFDLRPAHHAVARDPPATRDARGIDQPLAVEEVVVVLEFRVRRRVLVETIVELEPRASPVRIARPIASDHAGLQLP